MINYLKGTLISKVENGLQGCNITIEVNNIGYSVNTNKKVLSSLPDVGSEVTIYTSLVHREDSMTLYGFLNREDRDIFCILQSVSGVGNKVGLLLLELGTPELVRTVISGDSKSLSQIKGIGPKLAQRIILELKDKMINWKDKIDFEYQTTDSSTAMDISKSILEAEAVLLSLGYSKSEVQNSLTHAISCVTNQDDAEELLRLALEWLSNL